MGEHAVVYGAPALVAAVDLRARSTVEARPSIGPDEVELLLSDLDHRETLGAGAIVDYARRARERWRQYRRAPGRSTFSEMREGGAAHVTLVALGEAMAAVRGAVGERARGTAAPGDGGRGAGTGGVRVEVRSTIPVGRGFGSSAAVGSAVAAAWLGRRGAELPPGKMEELVGEVERRQHGDPSGVDAAAVLRGGLVWAEASGDEGPGRFRRISVRSELLEGFRLVDTGPPAQNTGEVVSAVRERKERSPGEIDRALARIRDATVAFRGLVGEEDPARGDVVDLLRECQRGLEGLGVVPRPVQRLVRAVEDRGGAAKISGAGALTARGDELPGGGLLLVYHPSPEEAGEWPVPDELDVLDVRLGADGLRREEAP